MKANLRVFWLGLPTGVGVSTAVWQLGVTYKHSIIQTVADQTWLVGCEYSDDTILPSWIEPMELDIAELRHWGIPEPVAKAWGDWQITVQARRHQIEVRDREIKRLTEEAEQLKSRVKELEDRLANKVKEQP